jgi:hypothetical protein
VKTEVGERTPRTPELAGCAFGNVEEIALGKQVLLSVHLQEAFTL